MGKEADNLFQSFELSESDAKKYDTVLQKFDEHFNPKNILSMKKLNSTKGTRYQVKQ